MSNFHPLEVMGRGNETQFQVGENFHYLISTGIDFRRQKLPDSDVLSRSQRCKNKNINNCHRPIT